jgi:hypothetical protein
MSLCTFLEKSTQKTWAVVLPVATCFAHKSQATFFGRFVACRSLFVASAWAVNDSLRSNMSPAFRRIARHALCGGVTQPFVSPSSAALVA